MGGVHGVGFVRTPVCSELEKETISLFINEETLNVKTHSTLFSYIRFLSLHIYKESHLPDKL